MMLEGLGSLYRQHHKHLGLPPLLSGPVPIVTPPAQMAQGPASAPAAGAGPAAAAAAGPGPSSLASQQSGGSPKGGDLGSCRRYSYQQLAAASNNFSPANRLGEGGFGPVFRGVIDGTPVALKVG